MNNSLHVITFGTDEHMLDTTSKQHARLRSYVSLVDTYTAIIFTKKTEYVVTTTDTLTLIQVPKKNLFRNLRKAYLFLKKNKKEHTCISSQDPFEVGFISYVFSRLLHIPLHVQIHTAIQSVYFQTESFRNKIQFLCARFIIKKAKSFRVVSQDIKKYLMYKGIPSESIVVSPIVDYSMMVPKTSSEQKTSETCTVLCVARFVPCKNLFNLIDAFIVFKKEKTNATLTLVGGGVLKVSILKYIEQRYSDYMDSITILDWVKDVQELYQHADIYVQPSLYEGFGSAIIEAMLNNVPVVVTPGVGALEYVQEGLTGYVTKGYTAEDILEGIRYVDSMRARIDVSHISKHVVLGTEEQQKNTLKASWEMALLKTS